MRRLAAALGLALLLTGCDATKGLVCNLCLAYCVPAPCPPGPQPAAVEVEGGEAH